MILLFSCLIGMVAGLRAMTAPAAVAVAAYLGWLDLTDSWLRFLGTWWAAAIFVVLAAIELVTDQLPSTPSRKVPQQFTARVLMGALAGAGLAAPAGQLALGALLGAVGAVVGTFAGAAARTRLAAGFGRDLPAALLEDVVAIGIAALLVSVAAVA